MNYINSITEAIGHTPLLKLNNIGKELKANLFVKLEYLNPSGSYKDRMALAMIDAAQEGHTWNGRRLEKGGVVIEASAGNTAPAVSMICAARGYDAHIYLYRYQMEDPKNTRLQITRSFGPQVKVSSEPRAYFTEEQIEEFSKKAPDLLHVLAAKKDCQLEEDSLENAVWLDQIYNPYNYIGQEALGEEIFAQLDGHVDAVGCSTSSGASLYGMIRGLQRNGVRPEVIFGVEPEGSEKFFDFEGEEARYGEFAVSDAKTEIAAAAGLKKWVQEEAIVDKLMKEGYPDRFFCISDEEARAMANRLCKEEGIFCGMSSGANVAAALKIAQQLGEGKNVVTVIVDRRDRYLSESPHERYVV